MVYGMAWHVRHGLVYGMVWCAWHCTWYDLTGMEWYMLWPGGHSMVCVIALRE